jgi:type I restriction enzyme, S subunit
MIWEKVFYNNLSTYISLINEELSTKFTPEPLSNHIKVLGGYAFKANEYKSSGIPVIRISDFQNEQIDLSNVRFYKEDKSFDKFQLFAGDIIIAMTGGTIGKLAIVQEGLGKLYLNQRVGKLSIINKGEFEPEYVYWLARGVQDKVKDMGYGGAQPNVSNAQIEALQFPFPDRKVQKKVIQFLNNLKIKTLKDQVYFSSEVEKQVLKIQYASVKLFAILEECSKQHSHLQLLRQTILQDAVQGRLTPQVETNEPAFGLLKRIKTEKQKLVKEGKLKKEKELPLIKEEEIPFKLPKGWAWCRMGEIAYVGNGSTPDKSQFTSSSEDIPYLKVYNIVKQQINFHYKPQYIKKSCHNGQLKRSITYEGDVLMNIVGPPLGKVAIVPEDIPECNINQAIVVIRPYEKSLNKWIYWYLCEQSAINSIVTKGTAGQDNISVTQSRNLLVPIPPLSCQSVIVNKIIALMKDINQLEDQITNNQTQAQKLLQAVLKETFDKKSNVYDKEELNYSLAVEV